MKVTWSSWDSENAAGSGDTDGSASSDAADSQSEKKLDENGTYTDKDEVAQYIYEYGHVPSNLTAADYDNADSMLPVEDGVTYQQCSLDDAGKQKLIFTRMQSAFITQTMTDSLLTRSIKIKRTK